MGMMLHRHSKPVEEVKVVNPVPKKTGEEKVEKVIKAKK